MQELQFDSGREKQWADLRALDPQEVCRRTGVARRGDCFQLTLLGREYAVDTRSASIRSPEADPLCGDAEFELLMLIYLIRATEIEPSGRWVNEKQLPGGSNFFTGPHHLPTDTIESLYGREPERFRQHCLALGGRPLDFGDASFAFEALPRIPLACVLHAADEEFPARAGFLFDSTIQFQLPMEIILALGHCFALRMETLE